MATRSRLRSRLVEKERPEVWDILEEVIREHPVMSKPGTNTAPSWYSGV